jgi:hypothetical protein
MRNSVRKAIEARIGPAIVVGPVDGRRVWVQLYPSLKNVLYRIVFARSNMFLAWHRHNLLFLAFLLETLGNPGITIRAVKDANQGGRERLARRLG